jgi:hypothetical protein
MPISERAHRMHEALVPGHKSTLEQTDPELIEESQCGLDGGVPVSRIA